MKNSKVGFYENFKKRKTSNQFKLYLKLKEKIPINK